MVLHIVNHLIIGCLISTKNSSSLKLLKKEELRENIGFFHRKST